MTWGLSEINSRLASLLREISAISTNVAEPKPKNFGHFDQHLAGRIEVDSTVGPKQSSS